MASQELRIIAIAGMKVAMAGYVEVVGSAKLKTAIVDLFAETAGNWDSKIAMNGWQKVHH